MSTQKPVFASTFMYMISTIATFPMVTDIKYMLS